MLLDLRATLRDREGDHEGALADFDRAMAALPDEAELHEGRAKALAALGRVEEALADAERVVALAPGHAFGYSMRAAYRRWLGRDPALVEADFDRSVELAPDDPSIRYHRGEHRMEGGRYQAALADFDRVIAVAPRIAAAYYGRGTCLLHLDEEMFDADEDWEEEDDALLARMDACIADLEKAIALGHKTAEAYMELQSAHVCRRDDDAAAAVVERAVEALPESTLFLSLRHQMRKARGDLEGAAEDRRRAEALGYVFRED
jgi:tetratricopeptide (TPR) repeat protein